MNAGRALVVVFALLATNVAAAQAPPVDELIKQLSSADVNTRYRAVQQLGQTASPDAAIPLAAAINDSEDAVQFEAIAAELNIFLAEKIVPRKRIGYVIEVRKNIAAADVFAAGPAALGARPVPGEVFTALRKAIRDETLRVGIEALYAFGALAAEPAGQRRRELLAISAPEFASMAAASDPAFRYAALTVTGRVYAARRGDNPIDQSLGDALISALNDPDAKVRVAGMEALGAMRYARALQGLTELFGYYGRGQTAEAALNALATIAHPSSAPVFEQQLAGKSASLKAIAIEGLARLGDRREMARIDAAAASDRDERVQLARAFASTTLADGPMDAIVNALRNPKQHDQAFAYLVELAPGRSAAFAPLVRDPDARVRADIADALGLAGDPAALPIVEPLLKDSEAPVVLAADRAAARLRAAQRLQVS